MEDRTAARGISESKRVVPVDKLPTVTDDRNLDKSRRARRRNCLTTANEPA